MGEIKEDDEAMIEGTKQTTDERIPVDRGWAWVILSASFSIAVINVGTEKAAGLFFIEFLRTFEGNVATTALVVAMVDIVYSLTSVMVLTIGLQWMSVRTSVCLGLVICALGYGVSSFSMSLEFLIVSQSLLIGFGISFYATPIFILIGEYFDKRKEIANAVFISGNSLGGFLMPLLYRYILDEYSLRGGLIITCGIILNSVVAGALLRPTSFYTGGKTNKKSKCTEKQTEQNAVNVTRPGKSVQSTYVDEKPTNTDNEPMHSANKSRGSQYSHSKQRHSKCSDNNKSINSINLYADDELTRTEKEFSQRKCKNCSIALLSTSEPLLIVQSEEEILMRPRANTSLTKPDCKIQRHQNTHGPILDKLSTSLPIKYLSQSELASSSVADLTQREKGENIVSMKLHRRAINKIRSFDYSLLTNGHFILFVAIYALGNLAVGTAHIYTPAFAREIGIDDQRISIMVSIISLTDFFGRILAGYVADKSWVSPTRIVLASQVVVACVMQFTMLFTEFWHLMLFVIFYGSTCGMIAALFPPMMLKAVGKERYRHAMALFVLILGLVFGVTLPLLGYIRDVTESYHASFQYISCSSFVAVGLLILQEYLDKKKCHKETDSVEVSH